MKIFRNIWVYFILAISFTIVANQGYKTFFFKPCSVHQWRQSDGASYALNYSQYQIPFLPSQVHHRFALEGKAMSELPIVYYIAGNLYKIFGVLDYFIRLIHFAIFVFGLVYLIKITRLFTKNIFLQLIPFLFTISSPYLFYYSANFLPDVSALSFSIVGLYYFLLFDDEKKSKYLLGVFVFFTLAGLLKISSILLFLAIIGYFGLQLIFNSHYKKSMPSASKLIFSILVIVSFSILFGWIKYDKYVADKYHFGGNLFGFLGIWDLDINQIKYILGRFYKDWMHIVFAKYTWIALFVGTLFIFRYFKSLHKTIRHLILISTIGTLCYLIAFFKVFDVHDYYLIVIFCLPILVFIAIIDIIEKKQLLNKKYFSQIFPIAICLLFCYSTYKSAYEQNYRYFGAQYNTFNKDYYSVEPYLRSIGLKKEDWVVSVPDPSPNMTLYLMNQVGFTECYNDENYNVNHFIHNEGVKYLIIGDSTYCNQPLYQPYCQSVNKIGQYKSISIYKVQ